MRILTVSEYMKQKYGQKVYRLSLSSGCTCPNRDGTLGWGGCAFCSAGGSGDFAAKPASLERQITEAKKRVDSKFPRSVRPEERKYIAYFQSYTNTYGKTDHLRRIFTEAAERPEIVTLSVGTRPDCLEQDKVQMLAELNQIKPVWVELGLQTIHEQTAEAFHRGYRLPVFLDAYRRLKQAGLEVIVHVILGLPGEGREDMLETVRFLAGLNPGLDGIKLQLLHILKGTEYGSIFERDPSAFQTSGFTLESYCDLVVACLKLLPPETVIHRLTGDGPKNLLLAPKWSADKKKVLNELNRRIREA
ncbi:MAG: TIGR01212 family radical SAM protein [Lachnospiraceae bacterium]|nr:TIGR01212 family radical SAM protein [Lachnospiraceae bacterium]